MIQKSKFISFLVIFLGMILYCSNAEIDDLFIEKLKNTEESKENQYFETMGKKRMGMKIKNECNSIFQGFEELSKTEKMNTLLLNTLYKCNKLEGETEILKQLQTEVEEILNNPHNPEDLYYATRLLLTLPKSEVNIKEFNVDFKNVFNRMISMLKKQKIDDFVNKGYLYESAVVCSKYIEKKTIAKALIKLYDDANSSIKFINSSENENANEFKPEDIGIFIKGATRISSLLKRKKFDETSLSSISTLLKSKINDSSLKSLFYIIEGLDAINKINPVMNIINFSRNENKFTFKVTNIFDLSINNELDIQIFRGNEEDDFYSLKITPSEDFVYVIDYSNDDTLKKIFNSPQIFTFQISKDEKSFVSLNYKVLGELEIRNLELTSWSNKENYRKDAGTKIDISLEKPTTIVVDQSHSQFRLKLESYIGNQELFSPNQAFIRISNNDQEIVYAFLSKKTGKFIKYFNLIRDSSFKNIDGIYNFELIIADLVLSNSQIFYLGKIDFSTQNLKYKLSYEEEKYIKRPNIAHIYKEADARATSLMSTVFSILVCVPSTIFIIYVVYTFVKLIKLPSFNDGLIELLIFFICIALSLVVLFMFFTSIGVFDAMKYLLFLFIIGYMFGSKGLKKLNQSVLN